jgi:hypothetical protein
MSSTLYVVGGEQRAPRGLSEGTGDWYRFKRAIILAVDTESHVVRLAVEYVSPPEACAPDDPAILFKSSSIRDGRLYACTQTEVLVYQLPEFSVVTYISLPIFNDLHHVLPTDEGTLLVAISGLDMVVELTMDGTVLREWSVIPDEDPWDRFSRTVDYRRVASTKPHHAHPNHLFVLDGEPWATRFERRDAISLTNPEKRVDIAVERPHDGILNGDALYFTTVDGHVVVAGAQDLQVRDVKDLTTAHRRDELLGWCRGILLDNDAAWVGFSRIRPTKTRENVGWVLRGFRKDLGTRIGRYDLETMACLDQINLEDAGMGAVFSILSAPAS